MAIRKFSYGMPMSSRVTDAHWVRVPSQVKPSFGMRSVEDHKQLIDLISSHIDLTHISSVQYQPSLQIYPYDEDLKVQARGNDRL